MKDSFKWKDIIYLNQNTNTGITEDNGFYAAKEYTLVHKSGIHIEVFITSNDIVYQAKKTKLVMITDISERVKIEKALKENEENYRNLIENINEVYYITDAKGLTKYTSPNIITFTGYPAEFFIGKSSYILIFRKDFKKVYNFYKEKIESGALDVTAEFRAVKKDGTVYWVEQITRIERDENGKAVQFRSVARDISERKAAEEKAQLLAQAVKSAGEGISVTDLENNIIYINDAFLKIYGYSKEELIGHNIEIIRSPNNEDPVLEEVHNKTLLNGWSGELINRKKDETDFPVYLTTSTVYNEENEPYALVGVTRDITERKLVELELEEYRDHLEYIVAERTEKLNKVNRRLTEEIRKQKIAEDNLQDQLTFLQILIDTIPSPVFIRNSKRQFTGCNKAYAEFHGLERRDIIGRYVGNIIPEEVINDVILKDDLLLQTGGQQKYEIKAVDGFGNIHDTIIYKATFNKSDGSLGGIVGIMLDITEIRKLEREILNSLEKEKELSELKSRFISVTSHEFRTPLTSILASADLLELYGRQWPESKYFEYIKNIQNAVEYLTELLSDVLTISRSETGKLKFNPMNIDLYELITNIIDTLKLSTPDNIKILYNYNMDEKIFYLDNKLITQILTNLLTNAVKYSPNGGNVILNVDKCETYISLTVTDDGIGISDEDQKRLFEPFHRGENVGKISGTGLGLSIAKKSAEMHNGRLSIESKLNVGTKITVLLNCNS